MLKDYFRLALANIRKRRLRSWLTMIGIFIGIAAVVSLISLGQGMQKAIEEQFFALGADKISITTKGPSFGPPGSFTDIQLTEDDVEVVQRANGVIIATDRIVEPITVEFNDKERFLYLVSLPQDKEERDMVLEIAGISEKDIIRGRNLKTSDRLKVIMSEDYYKDPKFDGASLDIGDNVKINGRSTEVVGFFKKTGNPFADISFVMNEEPMRDLLDMPDKVGLIAAQIAPGANMELVVQNIEKDLRNHRNVDIGEEDFDVQTGQDTLETLTTVLSIVTAVLVGIAAISLLVGGIGIMNTMYTAVLERRREIGIMKAIGGTKLDIISIFLIESGMLGLAGGFIGMFLGVLFSLAVQWIAFLGLGTMLIKADFPWYLLVGSLVFSFLVGSLAGTYPALQAAKLQPVEALRS